MRPRLLVRVANFAWKAHRGQVDDAGKDYFSGHITQVVGILSMATNDESILAAGYLHDTLEDTDTTYEELVEEFGEHIATLVLEVTHDGKKDTHGYYFPRLRSQEAIMIKFADRLSNISRMETWDDDRRAQYLRKSKFWKSEGPEEKALPRLSTAVRGY